MVLRKINANPNPILKKTNIQTRIRASKHNFQRATIRVIIRVTKKTT